MTIQNRFTRFSKLLNIAMLAGACGFLPAILPSNMQGQDLKEAQAQPQVDQRTFASPEVYKNFEEIALKSSEVVLVCKRTGRVLYEGPANDEG
jgi:hypothetical protein